jgi:hypothetical protein
MLLGLTNPARLLASDPLFSPDDAHLDVAGHLRRLPPAAALPLPAWRQSKRFRWGRGRFEPSRSPGARRPALVCRADLQQDAPFAAAIGACVLASLAFPPRKPRGEEEGDDEDGVLGATDTRMGVMGIISLLPYFNWLVSETSALLFLSAVPSYV